MIIDFHAHALPPYVKANRAPYLAKDTAFAAIFSGPKAKIATADDLITSMDRNEVDFSVIVNYSWSTHAFCVETNDYILEMAAKYPRRLAGFCAVSSLTDDTSLKEIERCAKAGARGIGEIRPDLQAIDYSQKDVIKSFAVLARQLKLIVLTHASEPVGHLYPGKGNATPDLLYGFISQLPDVPVVCAHWGGGLPFYTLMPEVRDALENVYFDTAASPFLYRPEIYGHMAQLIGSDRILFGSDFPVMPQKRVIDEIKNSALSKEDTDEILSVNAQRLLKITDSSKSKTYEPTNE
jgi:predicted TIM-barrel fold metal-dependent hydrolase